MPQPRPPSRSSAGAGRDIGQEKKVLPRRGAPLWEGSLNPRSRIKLWACRVPVGGGANLPRRGGGRLDYVSYLKALPDGPFSTEPLPGEYSFAGWSPCRANIPLPDEALAGRIFLCRMKPLPGEYSFAGWSPCRANIPLPDEALAGRIFLCRMKPLPGDDSFAGRSPCRAILSHLCRVRTGEGFRRKPQPFHGGWESRKTGPGYAAARLPSQDPGARITQFRPAVCFQATRRVRAESVIRSDPKCTHRSASLAHLSLVAGISFGLKMVGWQDRE